MAWAPVVSTQIKSCTALNYRFEIAIICFFLIAGCSQPSPTVYESRVVIQSDGWELVGDLNLVNGSTQTPVVLLLNQAAGDRRPYLELAHQLADRKISSLRLDLRGHGESINQGRFVPGRVTQDPMIWSAEIDISAAIDYLESHPRINPTAIGIVGASYSGQETAEAVRAGSLASAFVFLSPGSFSRSSISTIDSTGAPWMFIAAQSDSFLVDISAAVSETGKNVEVELLPGASHATDMFSQHPDLAEMIAEWFAEHLH